MSNQNTGIPVVPGYEILEKIGEGGMGEVYRAIQLSLRRTVAIKFLNPFPKLGTYPAETARLQREPQLMAALSHPNVVGIYDSAAVEGQGFLVLEYVSGSTLRAQMLSGKPFPLGAAADLIDTIARALSYIHDQGVLHLDLKPENVLCDKQGKVKITDFGLSVPQIDLCKLNEMGLNYGTLDYCSPEQRFGLPFDHRSDLFSLAVISYELLTGSLPGRAFVPCSRRNRRLPRAVDGVLRRALDRDPDHRYGSVEDFRRDLLAALRPKKIPALYTVLINSGLVFLVALPFSVGKLPNRGTGGQGKISATDVGLVRVMEGHTGFVNRVAVSPDGMHALSASSDNSLCLWSLKNGREVRRLTGHEDQIWGVAISPNGRQALSGSLDRSVRLWDLESGREIGHFLGHKYGVWTVAFSPDGKRALTGGWDNVAVVWDLESGEVIQRLVGHHGLINGVAFSPDGQYGFTASWDHSARKWDLTSGHEVKIFEGHTAPVSAVAVSADGAFLLTGGYDRVLRLWNVETAEQVACLEGHTDPVCGVALSADGKRALSGSGIPFPFPGQPTFPGERDYSVRLWDLAQGKQVMIFKGHKGLVQGVAFLPDGHQALSGSWDKTLRLWQLP